MERIVILARLVRDCRRPHGRSCFMPILALRLRNFAHLKKPLGSCPVLPDDLDFISGGVRVGGDACHGDQQVVDLKT